MNLSELKQQLRTSPELHVSIQLPGGELVPAHYHVTEVGLVTKKFVDCGGTIRASEACVLQTYIGSCRDDGHRLTVGKLAKILDLAQAILPSDDLSVEVEYEDDVISQFPLIAGAAEEGAVVLRLGQKHTDCLAKDKCGIADDTDGEVEAGCCGGTAKTGGCC